ncbi:MAG: S8 family serine peptidase [Bacteroidia bacterium]|nr:S8 family serine peptidase [Bacteroidia bacterium]MCF8425498.1 S8 family serine peptidase [Bacteroidia bacterium]MCF8447582.1 S8 family serine peptidase [Bacteroidia bacterium]
MRFFLLVILVGFGLNLSAQQRFYFVAFKDKPNYKAQLYQPATYISTRAIERRSKNRVPLNVNDIPPDSSYLAQLAQLPLLLYGNSRWLNGSIVLCDSKSIEDSLLRLPFVESIKYLGPAYFYAEEGEATENSLENQLNILEQSFENKKDKVDSIYLGRSQKQIEMLTDQGLMNSGINGEGVLIAVLDAGFKNVDKLPPFKNLMNEKRILSSYDFVEKEEEVFEDDDHGLAVLSCLAADQPGVIMGTAPKATYILLRSENASTEFLVEEYFWTLAAEYADSAGADIINSSLGYTKHDDKKMGHKYSELDGKSTIVTQAAEIAASKGILVVVSAGNEGNDPWRQISAPADAPHCLSVGAVDKFGAYVGFSSVGPTADKRIKPDLAALGKSTTILGSNGKVFEGNGTSYACPIISGTAAQLLQLAPLSSAIKTKEALMLSCDNYYNPDKYIGSGIPNLVLAAKMVQANKDSILDARELEDKNIHVLIFSRLNQKVTIASEESTKGEFDKVAIQLKKGLNRVVLKGYKKRPSGLYHLSVAFPQKVVKYSFMKP